MKKLLTFLTLLTLFFTTAWAAESTGEIYFGTAEGSVKINAASVSAADSQDNTWTITTVGTTSFTQHGDCSQVGSSNKPATSITFTTTLSSSVTITHFEAKFGGYSNTAGSITLKVGDTSVATGELNGTNDVIVTSTPGIAGTVLTVTVTDIDKGVKCYYISYTYDDGSTPAESHVITVVQATGGTITSPVNGTTAAEGSEVSLSADVDDAYNFGNWVVYKTGEQNTTVSVDNNKFTMPTYDVTVTATYTAKPTYGITVTNGTASPTSAYEGQTVTLTPSIHDGEVIDWENTTVFPSSVVIDPNNLTFTMPGEAVTIAFAFKDAPNESTATLTNANIVAAGDGQDSYRNLTLTDEKGKTWHAYAIKNKHSNATSSYHFLQIKKYASNTAYYIQVPEYGTKITKLVMTVSGSNKPMTDGGNSSTLFFSNDNTTSATGIGVVSGTGASSVTIDCSSLNLNTGYITAGGAVRIWDVTVYYEDNTTPPTPTTAKYYLVGTFNMDGENWVQIDPEYEFTDNQDGTLSLNGKDLPDNVQFKIIKVDGNSTTWYGGSVSDGKPYGLHGGWHTNIPLRNEPYENQTIQNFKMEVGGESNFTIYTSTMTFDVEKTKLYLRKSTDNWANHEMTPVTGGWTLESESFVADALFHFVDGWNVQHGTSQTAGGENDYYWINQSATDIVCNLAENKPNFYVPTAGDYTLTVNSDKSQLTVHCILPTYTVTIAEGITGGTVNASPKTNVLAGTQVKVYPTPSVGFELSSLTYTIDGSTEAVDITQTEGVYCFAMPAENVSINATFTYSGEITTYIFERTTELVPGKKYLIVNETNQRALMFNGTTSTSLPITIIKNTTAVRSDEASVFTLGKSGEDYTFSLGEYTLANSSGTTLSLSNSGENDKWNIDFDDNNAIIKHELDEKERYLRYLANSSVFRAYMINNNYSGSIPVQLYMEVVPEQKTLAEIIALGENAEGKTYKISNEDGLLGVYSKGTSVWFKDDEQTVGVDYQNPNAASYEYYNVVETTLGINKSEKDFAQNNWIEVVFPSDANYTNAYVSNLTGTYSCENGNPKLDVIAPVETGDVNQLQPSESAYELNPYMAVNFAGNQTYTNNGETQTFFFSMPKAQEYAQILWAVWDGSKFNMPTGEDNYYGFEGSFTVNNQLNSYSLDDLYNTSENINKTYNFKAIIRKSASKAGPYEVYPTDLNPDVPTAINGVVVNGAVKSVKYVNVAGIVSDVPFQGVNIVVTEYTDGSRTTSKMLKK